MRSPGSVRVPNEIRRQRPAESRRECEGRRPRANRNGLRPVAFRGDCTGRNGPGNRGFSSTLLRRGKLPVAKRIHPLQSKPKPRPTHPEIAASLEASGGKGSYPRRENLGDSAEERHEDTEE
jgi:hypothetical protein